MSNIKTAKERLANYIGCRSIDIALPLHEDVLNELRIEEVRDLRAALAKAEQERDERHTEADQFRALAKGNAEALGATLKERDALQAKLQALEGKETALWGNEGWMSSFGVCVGRDTSDCIDLIFTKVAGSEYQLYANEAAYLRYLLNKADIPGYAAAGATQGDVVVTKNEAGQIVAVTRQDAEGNILKVIDQSAPVPEGWQIVPRTCTKDMADAAWGGEHTNWREFAEQFSKALSAAPRSAS